MSDREDMLALAAIEADEIRRQRYSKWCPHKPHPKQAEFLAVDSFECLFGGAAGGGKSDALLMAALQYVDVPGYAALIVRRTFRDLNLPDSILTRAHEWLDPIKDAEWSEKHHRFTFRPSGATLTFGHLDTEADKYSYQSAAFQYIGLDEATQFPEGWYRYLLSRLRRPAGSTIPPRARLGSNPGNIGHAWVQARFIDSQDPKIRFIPSWLADNPSIDAAEYRKGLAQLDETTRRQLEEGIWVQDGSGLVYRPVQQCDLPADDTGDWQYLLGVDFGVRDACAYVVVGWRKDDRRTFVIESMKESDKTVTQSAERVKEYQRRYPLTRIIGDLGGMGKAFGIEFQRRHGIPIEPAEKTGKLGYIGLMNGAIERGELMVCHGPQNEALLKELGELPWSDETRQRESPGFDNHLTDALLYSWRSCWSFLQKVPEVRDLSPRGIIRAQTADVWKRHEEDRRRQQAADYDFGAKFQDEEELCG